MPLNTKAFCLVEHLIQFFFSLFLTLILCVVIVWVDFRFFVILFGDFVYFVLYSYSMAEEISIKTKNAFDGLFIFFFLPTIFNNSKNIKTKGNETIDIAKMSNNLFGKFFSFAVTFAIAVFHMALWFHLKDKSAYHCFLVYKFQKSQK